MDEHVQEQPDQTHNPEPASTAAITGDPIQQIPDGKTTLSDLVNLENLPKDGLETFDNWIKQLRRLRQMFLDACQNLPHKIIRNALSDRDRHLIKVSAENLQDSIVDLKGMRFFADQIVEGFKPRMLNLLHVLQDIMADAYNVGISEDAWLSRFEEFRIADKDFEFEVKLLRDILEFARDVKARKAKEAAGAGPNTQNEAPGVNAGAGPEDETAFRPASEFIDERFPTIKEVRKALAANPWIRTGRPTGKNGKPIPNRLIIHAGDWLKFRKQGQAVDPLDMPGTMVDEAVAAAGRQEEIRKMKGGAGK